MDSDYFAQFLQLMAGLTCLILLIFVINVWHKAFSAPTQIRDDEDEQVDPQKVIYPSYLWSHPHWPWI